MTPPAIWRCTWGASLHRTLAARPKSAAAPQCAWPTAARAAAPFREKLAARLSFGRWNRPLGNPVAGRGRNVQRPARGRAFHARHDADNGALTCRFHGLANVGKTSELEKVHV